MENQRTFLFIALMAIGAVLFQKWIDFTDPVQSQTADSSSVVEAQQGVPGDIPTIEQANINTDQDIPVVDVNVAAKPQTSDLDQIGAMTSGSYITVETDMIIAKINTAGGALESVKLKKEPVSLEKPDQGFPLLTKTANDIFITQDGLAATNKQAPSHRSEYNSDKTDYALNGADSIIVPLRWKADNGTEFVKTYRFRQGSYLIDVDYQIDNQSGSDWVGIHYGSLLRTADSDSGSSFGRLPSHTGPAYYTQEEKYDKITFDDMEDEALNQKTADGWVAMLQHYFVAAWVPEKGNKAFDTRIKTLDGKKIYEIRYQSKDTTVVPAGQVGHVSSRLYIGSKEQRLLKAAEEQDGINGLALTVDYGFLTFIADPLFTVLSWIHNVIGNWGWSIILLTVLIKAVFYPLSAASYKSMAGMKKLQPRIKTLKERYKEDKPKFQAEMMALYKKEKINPAGGCLPILIQIPVFISLYWALLESVEIRLAPFALWWQDLSAPDPYYVLPVLMGLSMWAQQKLNPAPMDDIQKKVMAIMPIALTFLFLTFPQGLVLYWVVNNVLSMAQQWFINKRHAT